MGDNMAMSLECSILSNMKMNKIPVTVIIINGFQIKGVIIGDDTNIIVVESDGKKNIIYKNNISTIIPMKNIRLD